MKILYSIVLGGIAGYIASRIMESHNSALVNIILGIVGGKSFSISYFITY